MTGFEYIDGKKYSLPRNMDNNKSLIKVFSDALHENDIFLRALKELTWAQRNHQTIKLPHDFLTRPWLKTHEKQYTAALEKAQKEEKAYAPNILSKHMDRNSWYEIAGRYTYLYF